MIDRICFQNPDNIIEMFYLPEYLLRKNNIKKEKEEIYDYIYKIIEKSKSDFETKYKTQIEKSQSLINGNNTKEQDKNQNDNKNKIEVKKNKKDKEEKNKNIQDNQNQNNNNYENYLNYHDEKNIILLRYFYEIVIRLAYVKYNDNPEMTIVTKLKTLLDELKSFLRVKIKSGNADSSITASILMIDPKLKNIDTQLDKFIYDHYLSLNKIFIDLYEYSCDNEHIYKPYDMTITYRFFYDNIIVNSEPLSKIFKNKMEYIDIISLYIRDKKINSYNINRVSKLYKPYEIMEYIDKLLDYEMIFREFCELIFFISRKYFLFYKIKSEEDETSNTITNKSISMSRRAEEIKKRQTKIKKLNSNRKLSKIEKNKDDKENKENKENNLLKEIDNCQ